MHEYRGIVSVNVTMSIIGLDWTEQSDKPLTDAELRDRVATELAESTRDESDVQQLVREAGNITVETTKVSEFKVVERYEGDDD